MWLYILQGIGYGFAAGAQPGPLQTYIISQTLTQGWRRILPAALAPLVSDSPIIVICLLILSQVPPWMQRLLYGVGGLFVIYLSYHAFQAWKNYEKKLPNTSEFPNSIWKAAFVNILNPNPYIFWTLVTGPILMAGWRKAPLYGLTFLLGFYLTFVLSLIALILLFGTVRQFAPRINRLLLAISAVALFCFGLYQLWLGITG